MPIAEGPMETGPSAGAGPGGPEDVDQDVPPQRDDAAGLDDADGPEDTLEDDLA
jgi:hypothetical protein